MIERASTLAFLFLTAQLCFAASPDAERGKSRAGACAACHGTNGISVNPLWPNLAGQKQEYLAKQLLAFKTGDRKDPLMSPMAAPLSAQDIDDLAAYFAGLNGK